MAQPESESRPLTDEEIEEGRERLEEFFDEVAHDIAEDTDRPVEDFQPDAE